MKRDSTGNDLAFCNSRIFFCSTSFPPASTRWIQLTWSGLCPLVQEVPSINHSNAKRQILAEKNSWECWESNPGPLGAKRKCYPLCYAAPTQELVGLRVCFDLIIASDNSALIIFSTTQSKFRLAGSQFFPFPEIKYLERARIEPRSYFFSSDHFHYETMALLFYWIALDGVSESWKT